MVPAPINGKQQRGFWYWPENERASDLLAVFMAGNFLVSRAGARLDGASFSSAENRAWATVAKASGMAWAWASVLPAAQRSNPMPT